MDTIFNYLQISYIIFSVDDLIQKITNGKVEFSD